MEMKCPVNFTFFPPVPRVKSFVRFYWVLSGEIDHSALTFPLGCPQMIFHRGECFNFPALDTRQAPFTISGQVNFPAEIMADGSVETIVVVFHPHAPGTSFNIPVREFYNQEIDGFSLGDRSLNYLAESVLNASSTLDAIRLIETWLLNRLSSKPSNDYIRLNTSICHLISDPRLRVDDLANLVGLSRRQFERVFFRGVGMSPKEYCGIVRFQRALWCMQHGNDDLIGIATFCGYSDQSHFIRECRRYSGMTPFSLIRSGMAYSDLFSSPV